MTTAKAIKFMGAMAAVSIVEMGQENAIRKLARDVGLTYWSAYRIVTGVAKEVSSDAFERINDLYLGFCAAQIKKFQTELREANRVHPDLDREAEALVAKLMDAKAGKRVRAAAKATTTKTVTRKRKAKRTTKRKAK